ncbi:DUF4349 domain-containing protein [Modestobacter muralis]|uniref:DUF4349 domain-containing protein n=1 Tax=Modestobacter muralis TaxID=1608614 RepID=A0A6P0ESK8_9ACTN|nr:DUF4349 domain-containing protein [Modestobacter muralis]NEK94097.1 DUF4349 domain-containing protein [Modestobacter muralis]NEN50864.1 DUF4349 domain-containing protein [Modestobacter muralis]
MRRLRSTAVTVLAVVVLAGCSASTDTGSGASEAVGAAADASGPGAPQAVPGVPGAAQPDRQVVQTGSASVAVEDPAAGAQRVSGLVEAAGGRVEERTERAASQDEEDGAGATADLVVRVPADALSGVLADLEELGDVGSVSVSRSDVTATVVDLDARISALQSSATRLQGLMDGAATTEALLAAEKALSERQSQLEQLQSQRASLADQVELSTLRVQLRPFGVAPVGGPDGFLEGLGTGWRALVTTVGATLVVLGVVLPWMAVAALLTAGALALLRLVRRRTSVEAPAQG